MGSDDAEDRNERRRREERALGRYLPRVHPFVQRVNQIRWLERAGQPEPWDDEVVRIPTIEAALSANRRRVSLATVVWNGIEAIGKACGRLEVMLAAADYAITCAEYDGVQPLDFDRILVLISGDIEGALREVILEDVVSISFFREAITWYERGHWRCGVTPEGKRLIY